MRKRPMSTITGEAAGSSEPMTTQQIKTAQRARMKVCRVSPPRPAAGLFCTESMLHSIGARFVFFGWGNWFRDGGTRAARSTARCASARHRDGVAVPSLDDALQKRSARIVVEHDFLERHDQT